MSVILVYIIRIIGNTNNQNGVSLILIVTMHSRFPLCANLTSTCRVQRLIQSRPVRTAPNKSQPVPNRRTESSDLTGRRATEKMVISNQKRHLSTSQRSKQSTDRASISPECEPLARFSRWSNNVAVLSPRHQY